VVKGDLEKSRILQVVSYQDKIKMPPTGKLKDEEIEALKEWVKMGAPWPDAKVTAAPSTSLNKSYGQQPGKHWAFQAVQHCPVPKVKDRSEEHTSELQSRVDLVCRLLLEKKKKITEC